MSLIHKNRAVFKSIRQDWSTPKSLFDELDREFHFQLDVCANSKNAKCKKYYSEEVNGLVQDWAPRTCWMNPPYGPDLKTWMKKAHEEARKGAAVVCLVPARTDTIWWHEYALKGEIRFIKGRIRFDNGTGRATFPSCVVIF